MKQPKSKDITVNQFPGDQPHKLSAVKQSNSLAMIAGKQRNSEITVPLGYDLAEELDWNLEKRGEKTLPVREAS